MPSLILPKSKAADGTTRTSSVFHIRYWCRVRRRSHLISTCCKNRKNAENALREFTQMLEQNRVGRGNPFLEQRQRRQQEQGQGPETLESAVAAFAADLRAGRLRKRGRRAPVCEKHAKLIVHHVEAILTGAAIASIDGLNVGKVNGFLDRCVQDRTIRTAQTRKHYERAIKSYARWLHTTERLTRDPLDRLDATFVDPEQDVVHARGEFTMKEVNEIVGAAIAAPVRAGLSGRKRALLCIVASCIMYSTAGSRVCSASPTRLYRGLGPVDDLYPCCE